MSYVIVCVAKAGRSGGPVGGYLKSYDPEAHDGFGFAAWTPDPLEAMQFGTQAEALGLWLRVPKCRPRRADGKPNRPLTAFTIACVPAP